MIKVGDWVEVIEDGAFYKQGDRFIVGSINETYAYCVKDNPIYIYKVRPLKTEAEKRGAKFGVCGVVNNTSAVKRAIGKKISFVKCGENSCKEEVWHCAVEGYDGFTGFLPSSIRLDHEPVYKEIPFSDATHKQRMDVSALRFEDGPVEQIICFDNGAYAFTTSDCEYACPITEMLTVRIPT